MSYSVVNQTPSGISRSAVTFIIIYFAANTRPNHEEEKIFSSCSRSSVADRYCNASIINRKRRRNSVGNFVFQRANNNIDERRHSMTTVNRCLQNSLGDEKLTCFRFHNVKEATSGSRAGHNTTFQSKLFSLPFEYFKEVRQFRKQRQNETDLVKAIFAEYKALKVLDKALKLAQIQYPGSYSKYFGYLKENIDEINETLTNSTFQENENFPDCSSSSKHSISSDKVQLPSFISACAAGSKDTSNRVDGSNLNQRKSEDDIISGDLYVGTKVVSKAIPAKTSAEKFKANRNSSTTNTLRHIRPSSFNNSDARLFGHPPTKINLPQAVKASMKATKCI